MRNRRKTRRNSNKIKELIENKKFRRTVSVLLSIIFVSAAILVVLNIIDNLKLQDQRKKLQESNEKIFSLVDKKILGDGVVDETGKIDETKVYRASISAVGDILCNEAMLEDGKNSNGTYSFSQMFTNVRKFVEEADVTLGTMETNFIDGQEYRGVGKYNSPIEFLNAVKGSGVDVISIAHNHALDFGSAGLAETNAKLKNGGFYLVGEKGEKFSGIIKRVNNIKIAFVGYTYGLSNENEVTPYDRALVNIYSDELAKADLDYAMANSDFIICIMHWGDVNSSNISDEQRQITDFLIANGADMILGSHPAVVETMEMKKGADGRDVLVAYSLGNYISSLSYDDANVELILNMEIVKTNEMKKAVLDIVDYTPIYVLDNGKDAENRYVLEDMKQLAIDYTNGDRSKIDRQTYDKIIEKLDKLNRLVNGE